jgi:hypothetical protein
VELPVFSDPEGDGTAAAELGVVRVSGDDQGSLSAFGRRLFAYPANVVL